MNNADLIELLNDLAEKDLSEGAKIEDHPASLAAAEIERLEREIKKARSEARKNKPDPDKIYEILEVALRSNQ